MPNQNNYQKFCGAALLALGLGLGCEKAAVPTASQDAPPEPAPLASKAGRGFSHVTAASPTARPPLEHPAPAPPRAPEEIARAFRAAIDPAERSELAGELWESNSPAAVALLHQLYLGERDEDVRTDLLAGLNDGPTPETREARYRFLLAALAPGQPKEERELALQFLSEFEDVRALATLQTLAADADPDIREAAAELLAERREAAR